MTSGDEAVPREESTGSTTPRALANRAREVVRARRGPVRGTPTRRAHGAGNTGDNRGPAGCSETRPARRTRPDPAAEAMRVVQRETGRPAARRAPIASSPDGRRLQRWSASSQRGVATYNRPPPRARGGSRRISKEKLVAFNRRAHWKESSSLVVDTGGARRHLKKN